MYDPLPMSMEFASSGMGSRLGASRVRCVPGMYSVACMLGGMEKLSSNAPVLVSSVQDTAMGPRTVSRVALTKESAGYVER